MLSQAPVTKKPAGGGGFNIGGAVMQVGQIAAATILALWLYDNFIKRRGSGV